MEIGIKSALPAKELLRSYSGRRLQFAIKMGILPTPESLSQPMKRQASNSSRNAHPSKYWKEKLTLGVR